MSPRRFAAVGAGGLALDVLLGLRSKVQQVVEVFILLPLHLAGNAVLQLEAVYLAQEGVEITRNIRDANLLNIYKGNGGEWTDNLTGCEAGCEADYTAGSLAVSQDRFLQYGSGFYNYTAGEGTLFKRSIAVLEPSPEVLEVAVTVTWEERGRSHQVKAATELYNWLSTAP